MADTKVSALSPGTTADATDRIPVARSPFGVGDNVYVTPSYIATYLYGLTNTWTGQNVFSKAGAVSTPTLTLTGAIFSGGSATTTKPLALLEPAGATSTGWSTSGTLLGVNSPSGFAGQIIDIQHNGSSKFKIDQFSTIFTQNFTLSTASQSISWTGSGVTTIFGAAAATLQHGSTNSATPVAQTVQAQGSRSGTDTNIGGGNFTFQSGIGTGTGTISELILRSPVAVASGTGAQTMTTGFKVKNGTGVLSSYTVATLPAAATSGAGATAFVTDAVAATFATAPTGGGALGVPVYSDGTNWLMG